MRNHLLFFTFMLILIASPAKAGLDGELSGMFNDMINVTPGGSYQTQRRGVITGGSISMRNKVVNPNLISFIPPSAKGGCNGIDMFAGSFSFINGAQFTQLARSIAQAAVGYAFQLAIEGMCPTCAQVISKLQSEIAKINALMRNSCEAGKAIVNATGLQNWSKERRREASSINTGLGFIDDYFKSEESSTNAPAQVLIQNGKSDEITGNVVYEALTESDAASWFVSGDEQIKMTLMSLTGTLIISKKPDNTDVQYDFRQPIVKVRDLVEGGSVEIYKCESAECLLPSGGEKEIITIKGMRARAKEMVWGTGTQSTGTGGIVRKMVSRNSGDAFTSDEQKFIEASSPGVYGLLRGMATEMQSAGLVAERLVDVVASELTNRIVEEMYGVVDNAVKGTGRPLDSSMLAVMRDVRDQIKEERRITGETIAGINSLIQLQRSIKESLRTPMNNKVH
jgi:conjugative transfer pilus assembly protein TraH